MPSAYQVLPTRRIDGSGKSEVMCGPLVDRLSGAATAELMRHKVANEADIICEIIVVKLDWMFLSVARMREYDNEMCLKLRLVLPCAND